MLKRKEPDPNSNEAKESRESSVSKELAKMAGLRIPSTMEREFVDVKLRWHFIHQDGTLSSSPKVELQLDDIITATTRSPKLLPAQQTELKPSEPIEPIKSKPPPIIVEDFGMMYPTVHPTTLGKFTWNDSSVEIVDVSGEWKMSPAMPGHVQINIPGLPTIIMRICREHIRVLLYLTEVVARNPKREFACRSADHNWGHTFIMTKDPPAVILDKKWEMTKTYFAMEATRSNLEKLRGVLLPLLKLKTHCKVQHKTSEIWNYARFTLGSTEQILMRSTVHSVLGDKNYFLPLSKELIIALLKMMKQGTDATSMLMSDGTEISVHNGRYQALHISGGNYTYEFLPKHIEIFEEVIGMDLDGKDQDDETEIASKQ